MSATSPAASDKPARAGGTPGPARAGARRLWSSALGLLAAAVLAVGVNLLAERLLPRARLDLTQQHLYTLADGTRQILAGLRDPITLRLFYSRRLGAEIPVYGAYADRVRAMLDEYVALSNGRLKLEVYDPEPFSETEDRAMALGLQGVPVDQSGEQVYFGLSGSNLVDEERSIAFFQPDRERFLEYDLTRLVYELSNPTRPVVGVMSSLPLNGDPRAMMLRNPALAQPAVVMQQLRQFFTVRDVPPDAQAIEPDVQVLLVAHPQHLSEAAQYAIDQFVLRGGKLILLLDPHSEAQASRPGPTGQPPSDTASSLPRLLNAWGLEASPDQVVLDLRGAWRVRANPQDRVQAVDYVAWYNLAGDSLNRTEVSLAQLEQITLASAGQVRKKEGATVEFTPLLTSSPQSMLADAQRVRQDPNPVRLLAEFRPSGERYVLAARVRGELATAFPDGPPPPPEGAARPENFPAHRARSEGPANIVVINDSDVLEDRFWVRVQEFFGQSVATPFSGNGSFIANLADALSGSDALISLRSRGESLRPFELVEDIRRNADAQYRQTERQLTEKLEQTERRLRELRQGGGQGGSQAQAVITPEQRAEIDAARAEIVATRRQLRAVQLDLRRDIEGLENVLRLVNVALVPALLTVFAILLAVVRARRRAAARA
ncbi:Gldg family protein [Siccirubricoccus sp. KC 17139]|uniref:Gldg family protein n=1 Tax=Siccirubricoccus soli TaxID=2899147 RepID=A0ABT1D162_9PROT|nr:Gldg family protein [Siccirubricoccus soli]MCO6415633.1 Gldg family protein [Siccirubricoccus soli]MCP2681765.1 Gldg family protein [Siccirubricoccus soli]